MLSFLMAPERLIDQLVMTFSWSILASAAGSRLSSETRQVGRSASENAQSCCLALEELSSTSTPRLLKSFLNLSAILSHVLQRMFELFEVGIPKAVPLCPGMSKFR